MGVVAKEKEKLECSGALDTDELNKTEEELEEEELDEIEEGLLDFGFLLRFSIRGFTTLFSLMVVLQMLH